MTKTSLWKEWNPGLDNDSRTLGEVRAEMPGNDQDAINFIVKLFENPASPIAFKGAINLERHDCVHIILGRGLLPQDEGFVIGYTMGTAGNITGFETFLFKMVTKHLYPHPYKFDAKDLVAYNLGVQLGRIAKGAKIYDFPFEKHFDSRLSDLREKLHVEPGKLKKVFACEQVLLPNTKESKRLPV